MCLIMMKLILHMYLSHALLAPSRTNKVFSIELNSTLACGVVLLYVRQTTQLFVLSCLAHSTKQQIQQTQAYLVLVGKRKIRNVVWTKALLPLPQLRRYSFRTRWVSEWQVTKLHCLWMRAKISAGSMCWYFKSSCSTDINCTFHNWQTYYSLKKCGGSFEWSEVEKIGSFLPLPLSLSLLSLLLSLIFEKRTCLWSCTCDKVSAWCFPFTTTLLCSSELEAVTQKRRNNTQGNDINSLWS